MATDIVTPTFPESIQEGTVAKWHKRPGEPASRDEVLVDIETDKVVIEVVAPMDGSLVEIIKEEQEVVHTGDLLARFAEGAAAERAEEAPSPAASGCSASSP